MFSIEELDNGNAVIHFDKETRITGKASERFRQWCDEKGVKDFKTVIIDGENLDFIDSMGIASFIRLYSLVSSRNGKLIITRLSQEILQVFKTLRLDSLLDLRQDAPSGLVEEGT